MWFSPQKFTSYSLCLDENWTSVRRCFCCRWIKRDSCIVFVSYLSAFIMATLNPNYTNSLKRYTNLEEELKKAYVGQFKKREKKISDGSKTLDRNYFSRIRVRLTKSKDTYPHFGLCRFSIIQRFAFGARLKKFSHAWQGWMWDGAQSDHGKDLGQFTVSLIYSFIRTGAKACLKVRHARSGKEKERKIRTNKTFRNIPLQKGIFFGDKNFITLDFAYSGHLGTGHKWPQ